MQVLTVIKNISQFEQFRIIDVVLLSVIIAMCIYTVVTKALLLKKIDIISSVILVLFVSFNFIKTTTLVYFYILISILYIYIILNNIYFFRNYLIAKYRTNKVCEHIKNDTADYYFCLNQKDKLIDYSASFTQIAKLSKKDLTKKTGWQIIFDSFDIKKINGEEFILSNVSVFLSHLDELVSKYKMYQFNLDLKLKEEKNITHYIGLIQPIYYKDKKVGTGIYLYHDKVNTVTEIKNQMDQVINSLFNYKNALHILMSLSEGVCLYFDYQEKLYYATQSFKNFMNNGKDTYTFQEVYQMIAEDDKEMYVAQSETVNSINVTRIKFKMLFNNTYYTAIEDSMYLTKDGEEFVSMIHILGNAKEYVPEGILSTKEAQDLLTAISLTPITPVVYEMEDILNKVLGSDEDEE